MLDWAQAQAGQCVRALRLEMLLLMVYYLQVRGAVLQRVLKSTVLSTSANRFYE